MDGHIAEGSTQRERPSEADERLRKNIKRPKERNYGVSFPDLLLASIVNHFRLGDELGECWSKTTTTGSTPAARKNRHRGSRGGRGEGNAEIWSKVGD